MQKYQSIYDRFWYSLDQKKVWDAFCNFIKNEFWDFLKPICKPSFYNEKYVKTLDQISDEIHKKIARATCKDPTSFEDDSFKQKKILKLIKNLFYYDNLNKKSIEYIVNLQIVFDELFWYKIIREEYNDFVQEIWIYFNDFPQLWFFLKIYKTKSAQIFPIISQATNNKVSNTLDILETKQYIKTIALFEAWMKEFISANDILSWKNVVEDMRGACDEVIKEILNDNKKWMKSIFWEPQYTDFWLTPRSKKIFEELMGWMDDLKHGGLDITKQNVIMIIGMTADFIQFVSSNYNPKN